MKKINFEILSSSIFLMINKKNKINTFLVLTDNKFCKLMTTKGKMPKKTLDLSSEIAVWIQFTRILMLQNKKQAKRKSKRTKMSEMQN